MRAPVTLARPLLALAVLSLIWGYNWVVMKVALAHAQALDFAALRTLLGALVLFGVLAWRRAPLRPPPLAPTLLLGLLQTTGFVGFTVAALAAGGGAGETAVLVYTMPFWVLLLAWPLLGERLRTTQWWAVMLALTGLGLMLGAGRRPIAWASSEVLAVCAGLCWAASAIVVKRSDRAFEVNLLSLTAWQMLLGALPLAALTFLHASAPIAWTGAFIAALIYNIVPGNAVAWLLWLYALQRLPAGMASMGMLATPVVGVVAASAQLGEVPSVREALGMMLIGIALAIVSLRAMRDHRRISPPLAQE
jgi:drug/metabolite transporter (DMT)-like permease